MAYYLQWSADTGSDSTNNELLEISGITGVLASIQYTVESSAISHSVNRSLYDIRRLVVFPPALALLTFLRRLRVMLRLSV